MVYLLKCSQGYLRNLHPNHFKERDYGLFISKNIVEAHGGKIWGENNIRNENNHIANHGDNVKEKGGGRGACFYFTLPIANEQLEPKERKGPNAEAVDSGGSLMRNKKKRVLIVDDVAQMSRWC